MPTDSGKRLSGRRYGADSIVHILMPYGIAYTSFNPGASFRRIHV